MLQSAIVTFYSATPATHSFGNRSMPRPLKNLWQIDLCIWVLGEWINLKLLPIFCLFCFVFVWENKFCRQEISFFVFETFQNCGYYLREEEQIISFKKSPLPSTTTYARTHAHRHKSEGMQFLSRLSNFPCWRIQSPWRLLFFKLLFLLKDIDCGYSLEPPRRGRSIEYPQSMFWAEIWKIS